VVNRMQLLHSTRAAAALAGLMAAMLATAAAGQEPPGLTLTEALRRADSAAYGNRIAGSMARATEGEAHGALRGVLPGVRIEAGYARTTDPIGTFGINLRQRTVTQADFDPTRLNDPLPRTDYGAALVLEQPLINVDAWAGRRAALRAADAARAGAEWERTGIRIEVVRAWYGAVLARQMVGTLEAAQRTAAAHVRQADAMLREGVVTRSDALLASVRAGEIEARFIEARGNAALARRHLAVLLGAPGDTVFTLPDRLPSVASLAALEAWAADAAIDQRGDVRAAESGRSAAAANAQRARAALLPRLNAMARYDWHSAAAPFRGDESWSVGIMATWSPFSGGSETGEVRASAARAAAAAAQHEAARARASLEVDAAVMAWEVALERVRIAEASVEQSEEALRIVNRRYEGGLASVVELLEASAMETESRLRHSQALHDAVVAAAERLQRTGRDPALLARHMDTRSESAQPETR
jgi:outer membrane protein